MQISSLVLSLKRSGRTLTLSFGAKAAAMHFLMVSVLRTMTQIKGPTGPMQPQIQSDSTPIRLGSSL